MSTITEFLPRSHNPLPPITADPTFTPPFASSGISKRTLTYTVPGYAADGDYIYLPAGSTVSMTLSDKDDNASTAGSWSGGVLPSAFQTNGLWLGFTMDNSSTLLYVVTMNSSTEDLQLSTINAAGSINNIGAAFDPGMYPVSPSWKQPSDNGSSTLRRDSGGTGNVYVMVGTSNIRHTFEIEINVSTGALVGSLSYVAGLLASYKTASGVYIGGFRATASHEDPKIYVGKGENHAEQTLAGGHVISSSSTALHAIQWGGRVILASSRGVHHTGMRAFTTSGFDTWVDEIAAIAGVA